MKLVKVMQQHPNFIDKVVGKCPICLKGLPDAVLITTNDFTKEDSKRSVTTPKDLREKRNYYHSECMEENIKKCPDYMQLRGNSSYFMEIYHIRYLYDCLHPLSKKGK